ncbi:ATP-binding cassette domain-containing protein [Pseudoroseicyclus sp. CXY001]|uniref:ATP-binding cassette domain-containing protein n=1 Tax=Pseudoroseicyclus sp. CXY001 TaxID=3242492 RepID=UPI00358DA956
MSDAATDAPALPPRAAAEARLFGPIRARLRLAGGLSIAAGLLWPVQAAAIALVISGWVAEGVSAARLAAGLGAFFGAALLRAVLEHRAGGILFVAAESAIAAERARLIRRAARAPSSAGSAALAALAVQKLQLLAPLVTRYRLAMWRVSVLPLVLAALAFSLSWVVGLIFLVAGPLIPVFMALIGMAAEDAAKRQMAEVGSMNAMLMERLSALLDIRLLGASERAAAAFGARAEALRERTMAVLRIAFLSSTVLELLAAVGLAMVAVFVGFTLLGVIRIGSWGGSLTLGQGLFLLLIAPEVFQPFRDLAAAWHDRAAAAAVLSELDALEAEPRVEMIGQGAAVPPLPGRFSLALRGAVAALPGQSVPLPDLALGPGEALAITGPSGVGKSTALAAIAGLVPLGAGAVEVCGQRLGPETADAWRARIAFVPQRVHVPDAPLGTWLDPRGTGADPWPALRLADADALVRRLPEGLATRLGERGGGVSGGEARRLMLARAVMAGGDLILADEPTADLDAETAGRIIAALARIRAEGRALIVATHDPALAEAMGAQEEMGA